MDVIVLSLKWHHAKCRVFLDKSLGDDEEASYHRFFEELVLGVVFAEDHLSVAVFGPG